MKLKFRSNRFDVVKAVSIQKIEAFCVIFCLKFKICFPSLKNGAINLLTIIGLALLKLFLFSAIRNRACRLDLTTIYHITLLYLGWISSPYCSISLLI